jgi:hypothetical protein
VASPELAVGAAPVSGSSPWQRGKGEEPMGVLTEVEIGQRDDG